MLPGAAAAIFSVTCGLIVLVASSSQSSISGTSQPRISPSRSATLASEPMGLSGCLRPRWPKMICFQPRVAEFERVLHRAEADVVLADFCARFAIDIAADEDGRAGGDVAERLESGDGVDVVGEGEVFAGVEAFEEAGEF